MAVVAAPLEGGYGNKCGVQLRHGSCWSAGLPTAPLKQIRDLFSLEHYPCPTAERDKQQETLGGGQWCLCRASPAAGGWDGKELSKPCL